MLSGGEMESEKEEKWKKKEDSDVINEREEGMNSENK